MFRHELVRVRRSGDDTHVVVFRMPDPPGCWTTLRMYGVMLVQTAYTES